MPSHRQSQHANSNSQAVPSKDMPPFPENFAPIFFQNQFRTKIELPTKSKYPNVQGQCAIITGSNTGLGFEAAHQLLTLGLSRLIMGVRSTTRGEAAANKLRAAANPSAKIDVWHLDMESYDSIQAFARNCADLATTTRIDMVILNAGLARLKFATTPSTNHEQTIQINHISTLLLTILLLPVLSSSKHKHKLAMAGGNGHSQYQRPPVLTLVNSLTAHLAKFPNNAHAQRPLLPSFDDPTTYDAAEQYGVSKLLNQLATVKLTELISPDDVIINMVDPGLTKGTGLARDAKGIYGVVVKLLLSIAGRPVNRGAATYVDAVLAHGKESHGCFLMNCKIAPLARWYYTDGHTLTDVIWTETMQELGFAGVRGIIDLMRASTSSIL
ncbi:hypothetical protein LTR46_002314 [Exophiala xenobiotica]|nr:hypothetical protein LTR46_002314 [Exophiala xenobiotica]